MKKRAKAMLPEIKELISQRALEETGESRETLADKLVEEIKIKFPKEVPPAWETIIKRISAARRHEAVPLDNPWHLGTLKDFPLPIEAIPSILAVQKSEPILTRTGGISIRHAIWIARLYLTIKDTALLGKVSWLYALHQRISEIAKTDFDTRKYDKLLSNPKKLLEQYELNADYSTYKRAFEETTLGVEFAGVSFSVDFLLIRDNKVYAPLILQGKSLLLELPYSDPDKLLEECKKQPIVKSIKTHQSETIIRFKEPISQAFENKEFNEFLYNLFRKQKENEQ